MVKNGRILEVSVNPIKKMNLNDEEEDSEDEDEMNESANK